MFDRLTDPDTGTRGAYAFVVLVLVTSWGLILPPAIAFGLILSAIR